MTFPHCFNLAGRRALVTGSSRGIGASLAFALAEAGADVMVHCSRNSAAVAEVADRIRALGRRSDIVVADLADNDGARRAHEATVAALGGIDILILNASIQIQKKWTEFTSADLAAHYAVNYRASFELLQLAVPAMMERGWGRILAIGSVQESRPHPEMLVYSSLKRAQTGLALGLAKELAPSGVTINSLAPGVIETDRNAAALSNPGYAEKLRSAIPVGYCGSPDDCAGAALLLCSDAGRYITGQNLFVDGGLGL